MHRLHHNASDLTLAIQRRGCNCRN